MQSNTDFDRKSITITVEAGDVQNIDIPAGATLVLDFDPSLVTFALQGDNLVISAPDGGETILHDYAIVASGEGAPELVLADGSVVGGDVFLMSLANDQLDMNTAADAASSGSGAGEYMDQAGHFIGAGDFNGALTGGDGHDGFADGGDGGARPASPDQLLYFGDTGDTGDTGGPGRSGSSYQMVTFDDVHSSDGLTEAAVGPWNRIFGTAGADTIVSDDSTPVTLLAGDDGNDLLVGRSQVDWLYGDQGADTLYGGGGDDLLNGGVDNDTFYASTGHDTVVFGAGEDTLIVQENALGSGSHIEVSDYDIGVDIIDFRGDIDITGVTKTAAGDYEFTATGGSGDTTTIHLAGVDSADFAAHTAGLDSSPDDIIQYVIDHSAALA